MSRNKQFQIQTYQNYLAMIKGSKNSQMFRKLFVLKNDQTKDVLQNGQLACAYYLSCILKIFDLISVPHATVAGTIKDMLKNNWQETEELKPGNVLIWEEKEFKSGQHIHIGFYLGNHQAISHRGEYQYPIIHDATYQGKRKITKILTHSLIE